MDTDQNSVVFRELLAKARAGDEDARNRIFAACRSYMHLIARVHVESWIRTKVDASDVVQQSLIDAHRGFADFRGGSEGEWLAWLKQIVNHRATDFVRRYGMTAKRAGANEQPLERRNAEGSACAIDLSDALPSPSKVLAAQENELLLAEALSELSEDYREVIILRSLERLPFADVAERMNRSRGAVQMLWMRALQELRSRLQNRIEL